MLRSSAVFAPLFALVVLIATDPALAAPQAPPPNLAGNPGFEDWPNRPEDGTVWGATAYSVGVEGRDDKPAGRAYRTGEGELDATRHSGKYAQYMQTTTWGRGAIARGVRVTAGHRYRVSVWVRVLSGKFQLGVCFAHAPWSYLGDWAFTTPGGQWTQATKEVTIPAACKSIATVMFVQAGAVYLDDLEIIDLGPDQAADTSEDALPLLPGKLAPGVSRKRCAVFDEPGFPSESPRPPDWYEATLQAAGLQVTRLGWQALCDPERFSPEKFDTLILATGGNFPSAAEKVVETFVARGGTLVVDESLVLRTAPPPDDAARRELEARRQDYLQGKGGYAYFDALSRHLWTCYGNMFELDARAHEWRATLADIQNYETPAPATYPEGLGVQPWPNTAQPYYARPFSEPLQRNPALATVLADFAATIPPEAKPRRERGAIRLCRRGPHTVDAPVAPEFACDLLLSLYRFAAPSGLQYPAFVEAGKHERDCEADCYVLRYHNARQEGGTLVHFGCAGARLLAAEEGPAVLLAALRLAESELPGECPTQYVQTANRARDLFSRYAGQSIRLRELLGAAARVAAAAGRSDELTACRQAHAAEQQAFERLSARADQLERLLTKRDGGRAYGHRARGALVSDLAAALARLDKEVAETGARVQAATHPPAPQPVTSPFAHLYFGLDNALGRGALGYQELRRQVESMGLRYEGYHLTSYRQEYTFNGHPFKREFESGELDPATGVVKPVKNRWPETAEDREHWRESFRWQLERVNTSPTITSIYGMDERDFAWSLWGPRDRALFLDYLRERYGEIGRLNRVWGTTHAGFEVIQLPVARPVTQPEHARWEDWTRFREVYRREREMKLSTGAVLRYAPDRKWRYLTWGTYDQHGKHPANGINFYEYGRELPVNGFEHSNEDAKEWLAFDICSMFSLHCTAEWGPFYFPPPTHQSRIDLLNERMWKGLSNGQAGWSLFAFSSLSWSSANYMDLVNRPQPLAWQLAEVKRRTDLMEHILLDGKREEPPVRIVYSPTTHRHTSWPGVEEDMSFRATAGLYTLLRTAHLHARAIDEQAVMEGHLSPQCRLLILSEVLFENDALHQKAMEYLAAGGHVLVTPGSGKFDQYGRRGDTWLTVAGVTPQKVAEPVIPLGEGLRYFSAANSAQMVGLAPVLSDEVRVLQRYAGGEAAVTETKVGTGTLTVVGCNLGLDCFDQWQGNPTTVMALLAPVLGAAGIEQEVTISRQDIMVRPWQHGGRRYLILASLGRDGIAEFELGLRGAWQVEDYLLGLALPVTREQGYSRVKSAIGSPGGMVLALTPTPGAQAEPATPRTPPVAPPPAPPRPAAAAPVPLDEQTPFEGRVWTRDGVTRLGPFRLELDVETGGGWGGNLFLAVRLGKERLRRRCVAGQETVFHFTERVLRVACREVTPVYPSNILARITVEAPATAVADCRLTREPYLGQESLVLSNGLLRARLLPRLGGRLIELTTLPDETNQLYTDPALLKQGLGSSWGDFGGLEENAGGWPGPYWNADFAPTIVQESPGQLVVRLAMAQPVSWAYGYANPQSGRNRQVKEYTLRRGESRLSCSLQAFNEAPTAMPVGLRTHPIFQVGGDGGPSDHWFLTIGGRITDRPFPFPGTYPAEGEWTALVDIEKRMALIQGFSPQATETLYMHNPPTRYGLELFARPREIPSGQALEFTHSLSLIRGLSGVDAARDGMAIRIDTHGQAGPGKGERLSFEVEAGGVGALSGALGVGIWRGDQLVTDLGSSPVQAPAGRAVTRAYAWDPGVMVDGEYAILARLTPAEGEALEARRPVVLTSAARQQQLQGLAAYEGQVEALKQAYLAARKATPAAAELPAMRDRAVTAALLLAELKTLIAAGKTEESQTVEQYLRGVVTRADKPQ